MKYLKSLLCLPVALLLCAEVSAAPAGVVKIWNPAEGGAASGTVKVDGLNSTMIGAIDRQDGFGSNLLLHANTPNGVALRLEDYVTIDFFTNEVGRGELGWSVADRTLELSLGGGNVLHVGEELHWNVRAAEAISEGDVVYASGVQGSNPARIKVNKYLADGTVPAIYILGIADEDIANSQEGKVTSRGTVVGTPVNFPVGTILYPSATVPGALTNVPPAFPAVAVELAFVIEQSPSDGTLAVRTTPRDQNRLDKSYRTAPLASATDVGTVTTNRLYLDMTRESDGYLIFNQDGNITNITVVTDSLDDVATAHITVYVTSGSFDWADASAWTWAGGSPPSFTAGKYNSFYLHHYQGRFNAVSMGEAP